MKKISEAYTSFLDMFASCSDADPGNKLNFLAEATILFKDIPGDV
jgi:hypothetical protein